MQHLESSPLPRTVDSVLAVLAPLAGLVSDTHRDADGLIGAVLALLAESLDVGLTFLARVDGPSLHILQAHDRAAMGMRAGDSVPMCDTY